MKKVIVIGAGFGGLSAAAILAKRGFDVTILEKNDQPGGRATLWEKDGFSFDMGPSWYMMPDVFERFFKNFGSRPEDHYSLSRLDPSYRIYFAQNDYIDMPTDPAAVRALFESLEPGSSKKLDLYLERAKKKYDMSMRHFLYKEYRRLGDMFNVDLARDSANLSVFREFDSYVKSYFKNEKLRKIMEYHVVLLGSSPKNAVSIYSLMGHVDFGLGVWYPQGGMNAVARATARLCEHEGVKIRYTTPVREVITQNARATGVRTDSGIENADIILTNADYHHAEMDLLGDKDRTYGDSYWKSRTVAPSAFILYLGLKKRLANFRHHTLFFHNDWFHHFDAIFGKNPLWADAPSSYVCVPSLTDATVAPEGCENMFVLVPSAAGLDDTDEARNAYRTKVIRDLEKVTGDAIEENIIVERIFSMRDYSSLYNAYKGTALGLAHTMLQTAYFRPHMRSHKVKDLYYVGQYTHPGVGVPMAFIGGEVIADAITQDHG